MDMSNEFAVQELPQKRTRSLLMWMDRQSLCQIAFKGMRLYLLIVLVASLIEFASYTQGFDLVMEDGYKVERFLDFLYFNTITILTVGYGDFHPVSYGKLISAIEGLLGVGLFSVLVAFVAVKSLLAPHNTIVFSKYAYYCTDPQRFLIIYVNTSDTNLGNVEISSYFKLGGDWGVRPSITAPFITRSVQTFYVDQIDVTEIVANLRDGDCLRVGLRGVLGFSNVSTSIQYAAREIFVLPDRKELVEYFEPRSNPDFSDPEFAKMFHYRPESALTLEAFVRSKRSMRSIERQIGT